MVPINIKKEIENREYMSINEDHLDGANIFLKAENLQNDFSSCMINIFDFNSNKIIDEIGKLNASNFEGFHNLYICNETQRLYDKLFGFYMSLYYI